MDLILEVAQFFFRIRAFGQKAGFMTSWGAGAFGFIRSLALLGPLTVPAHFQNKPPHGKDRQRHPLYLMVFGFGRCAFCKKTDRNTVNLPATDAQT